MDIPPCILKGCFEIFMPLSRMGKTVFKLSLLEGVPFSKGLVIFLFGKLVPDEPATLFWLASTLAKASLKSDMGLLSDKPEFEWGLFTSAGNNFFGVPGILFVEIDVDFADNLSTGSPEIQKLHHDIEIKHTLCFLGLRKYL